MPVVHPEAHLRPFQSALTQCVVALGSTLAQLQNAKNSMTAASQASVAMTELELRLDKLLERYHHILDYLSKDAKILPSRKMVAAEYAPAFRAIVAFSSIYALSHPRLKDLLGREWGRHVFSERDFKLIGFDTLDYDLPPAAVKGIMPAQVDELQTAMADIVAKFQTQDYIDRGTTATALKIIAKAVGAVLDEKPIGMPLLTVDEAAKELKLKGTTAANRLAVEKMAAARKIIAVPLWTGEERYPQFQFNPSKKNGLHDSVTLVCGNASPRFRGWALALWMTDKVSNSTSYFQKALGGRGLWVPDWGASPADEFTINEPGIKNTKVGKRQKPYYRVSRNDLSPFFFSTVAGVKAGATPPPAGRFDLPAAGEDGSVYVADTGEGAWAEVLDQEPLVTLRDILRRTMWHLRPEDDVEKIANVSHFTASLPSTTNRGDTQALARNFFDGGRRGMKVTLRGRSTIGFVLFGAKGARLPNAAGIGSWDATPTTGIADADLWKYIASRKEQEKGLPVRLARFPGEVEFPRQR